MFYFTDYFPFIRHFYWVIWSALINSFLSCAADFISSFSLLSAFCNFAHKTQEHWVTLLKGSVWFTAISRSLALRNAAGSSQSVFTASSHLTLCQLMSEVFTSSHTHSMICTSVQTFHTSLEAINVEKTWLESLHHGRLMVTLLSFLKVDCGQFDQFEELQLQSVNSFLNTSGQMWTSVLLLCVRRCDVEMNLFSSLYQKLQDGLTNPSPQRKQNQFIHINLPPCWSSLPHDLL